MRRIAPIALLLVALGASSCGDDAPSGPLHPVAAAIDRLQASFADGDVAGVCRLMTESAQRQAGRIGHSQPSSCERDVQRTFTAIREGGGWGEEKPATIKVAVKGDRATATIAQEGWAAAVPFAKDRGAWKLDGFFGTAPQRVEAIAATSKTRAFPPPGEERLEIVDRTGLACPGLSARRFPRIDGGCELAVSAENVPIRILTPFGDFKFADCSLTYQARLDSQGRTWTTGWLVQGPLKTGCSDVQRCADDDNYDRPWKGRLRSDGAGGFLHHVNMCLQTCVGPFAGDFAMRLIRYGDRWRAEPTDVGTTGFRLDGAVPVDGNFDIRAAA